MPPAVLWSSATMTTSHVAKCGQSAAIDAAKLKELLTWAKLKNISRKWRTQAWNIIDTRWVIKWKWDLTPQDATNALKQAATEGPLAIERNVTSATSSLADMGSSGGPTKAISRAKAKPKLAASTSSPAGQADKSTLNRGTRIIRARLTVRGFKDID